MNKIYIMHIEPLETRYTGQLKYYLPKYLLAKLHSLYDVVDVDGTLSDAETTPGAFLNFVGTNIYKSTQSVNLFDLIAKNQVKNGDIIFYTDAWNPTIIQLRYTLDLMGIDAKIAGMWHAGSYDKWDFLGRLIKNKGWSYNFERSLLHAIDFNFFATDFHIEMFLEVLFNEKYENVINGLPTNKIVRTGLPLDYLPNVLQEYSKIEKEDIILFPHRVAPEKQPDIFRDLAASMPEYKFIVAQDEKLTKDEYHTLLGASKIVFSANLQETLGISAYEGAIVGAIPMLPDRLSYHEMYPKTFLYPTGWTSGIGAYKDNKTEIMETIRTYMTNYKMYRDCLPGLVSNLKENYFSSKIIIDVFKGAKK